MSSQADALNHVFDVLSFDQETKDFLIAKRLTTVRKLVNHSQATYQAYCDEAGSKLSLGDRDQILLFRAWFISVGG